MFQTVNDNSFNGNIDILWTFHHIAGRDIDDVEVYCVINFYITIMMSILYYTIDIPSILKVISTTSSPGQVTLEVHTRSPGDKLPSSSLLI